LTPFRLCSRTHDPLFRAGCETEGGSRCETARKRKPPTPAPQSPCKILQRQAPAEMKMGSESIEETHLFEGQRSVLGYNRFLARPNNAQHLHPLFFQRVSFVPFVYPIQSRAAYIRRIYKRPLHATLRVTAPPGKHRPHPRHLQQLEHPLGALGPPMPEPILSSRSTLYCPSQRSFSADLISTSDVPNRMNVGDADEAETRLNIFGGTGERRSIDFGWEEGKDRGCRGTCRDQTVLQSPFRRLILARRPGGAG
jgi:hypothetical protein